MKFVVWYTARTSSVRDILVIDSSGRILMRSVGGQFLDRQEHFTYTNVVAFDLDVMLNPDLHVWLNFSAVPVSARPALIVKYTAPWRGICFTSA